MNNIEYKLITPFDLFGNIKSSLIHLFYNKDRGLILSNSGISLVVEKKYVDQILNKQLSKELVDKLVIKGFTNIYMKYNECEKKVVISLFLIDYTTSCNLKCVYCLRDFHEKGKVIGKKELDSILNFILNYAIDNNLKHINIQPWGGEPLLAYKEIIYTYDFFEQNGIKANISIQTNGTLLSENIIKEFKKRDIGFGFSVDGCKKIHNMQRKYVNGKESFDDVKKAIIMSKKYYSVIGSIQVVTKNSIDYIDESIDELTQYGINHFKFNMMRHNSNPKSKEIELDEKEVTIYLEKVMKKIIDLNKAGKKIIDQNILDRIYNLLCGNCNDICHGNGCIGGYNFISIDKEGNVYPCDTINQHKFLIGNIQNISNLNDIIEKSDNPYFKYQSSEKCVRCPWFTFCKGGCKQFALKSESGVDELECKYNNYLYRKIIDFILNDDIKIELLSGGEIKIRR